MKSKSMAILKPEKVSHEECQAAFIFMTFPQAVDKVKSRAVDPERLLVIDVNMIDWLHGILHKHKV